MFTTNKTMQRSKAGVIVIIIFDKTVTAKKSQKKYLNDYQATEDFQGRRCLKQNAYKQ